MTKYHNRKTVVNGKTFDSVKEANRYRELLLLERAGVISGLDLQRKYELIPAQYETYERYSKKTGKRLKDGSRCVEQAVNYYADFVYEKDGETIVEDVKGYRDTGSAGYAKFVLKRKMMLYFHGIKIQEI